MNGQFRKNEKLDIQIYSRGLLVLVQRMGKKNSMASWMRSCSIDMDPKGKGIQVYRLSTRFEPVVELDGNCEHRQDSILMPAAQG